VCVSVCIIVGCVYFIADQIYMTIEEQKKQSDDLKDDMFLAILLYQQTIKNAQDTDSELLVARKQSTLSLKTFTDSISSILAIRYLM
jgi:hypothetical protein